MFEIKIADVLRFAPVSHQKTLKCILQNMSKLPLEEKHNFYGVYAPHLDFGMSLSRKVVGHALGCLWEYCNKNQLPCLNYLVVRQDTNLPGEGVQSWYVDRFGSLTGFEEYCRLNVELCLKMFAWGLIVIVD